MASFVSRFFGWLLGKKPKKVVAQPGMNIPAPQTLVSRVATVAQTDERRMIRLAEESLARGFPDQAIVAYRKAASRLKTEGQHKKRISVLNQLARVNPNDPAPFLELVEANEQIDRKRDADLARMAAAAALRNTGHHQEANDLEMCIAARGPLPPRSASVLSTHDNEPDSVNEMPGDAVPMMDGPMSNEVLPPVMPTDLGAPTGAVPSLPSNPLRAADSPALTMSAIDASGPLELPMDPLDDVEIDSGALSAMDVDAVFDPPLPPLDLPTDPTTAPSRDLAIDPSLLLDEEFEDEDDLEDRLLDPNAQTMAYNAIDVNDLALSYDPLEAPTRDPNELAIPASDDEDTYDPAHESTDAYDATLAMEAVHAYDDVGAQTMAYNVVDHANTDEAGAMTIGFGMQAADDDNDAYDDDEIDPMAQTIAVSAITAEDKIPIANTRALNRKIRFNIADAATQMDTGELPEAVVGSEHEGAAREASKVEVKVEDVDGALRDALQSKIGR